MRTALSLALAIELSACRTPHDDIVEVSSCEADQLQELGGEAYSFLVVEGPEHSKIADILHWSQSQVALTVDTSEGTSMAVTSAALAGAVDDALWVWEQPISERSDFSGVQLPEFFSLTDDLEWEGPRVLVRVIGDETFNDMVSEGDSVEGNSFHSLASTYIWFCDSEVRRVEILIPDSTLELFLTDSNLFRSVLAHEAGHVLFLGHSGSSTSPEGRPYLMAPSLSIIEDSNNEDLPRFPDSKELEGLRCIYGSSSEQEACLRGATEFY